MWHWREEEEDRWFSDAFHTPAFSCDACGRAIERPYEGCLAWRQDIEPTQVKPTGLRWMVFYEGAPYQTHCFHWECYDVFNKKSGYKYLHQEIGQSLRIMIRNMNIAYRQYRIEEDPERTSTSPLDWHEWQEEMGIPISRRQRKIFSKKERDYIRQRAGGKCFYCEEWLHVGWHVDHLIPLSRGGTNDMDNVTASCKACNSEKRDMTHHEYMEKTGRIK